MATQKEILERLDTAATNAENATDAYNEVLTTEGEQDILLVDGTTTPNLNKRLKGIIGAVKSVQGKTGDIVLLPKDIMSVGSNNLNATPAEDPVPEIIDENGTRDPAANAQAQALLNRIAAFGLDFGAKYINGAVYRFSSAIEMSGNLPFSPRDGDIAVTSGYYSKDDGGGSKYTYLKNSTAIIDGFITHDCKSGGRWVLFDSRHRLPMQVAGAKVDGVTDDRTAFLATLSAKRKMFLDGVMRISGPAIDLAAYITSQQMRWDIEGSDPIGSTLLFDSGLGGIFCSQFFRGGNIKNINFKNATSDKTGVGFSNDAGAEMLDMECVTFTGWRCGLNVHAWNSSLRNISSRSCYYAGSFYGTSQGDTSMYAIKCNYSWAFGCKYAGGLSGSMALPNSGLAFSYANVSAVASDECGPYLMGRCFNTKILSIGAERGTGPNLFDFSLYSAATGRQNIAIECLDVYVQTTDGVTAIFGPIANAYGSLVIENTRVYSDKNTPLFDGSGNGIKLKNVKYNSSSAKPVTSSATNGLVVDDELIIGSDYALLTKQGYSQGGFDQVRKVKAFIAMPISSTAKIVIRLQDTSVTGIAQGVFASGEVNLYPVHKSAANAGRECGKAIFSVASDYVGGLSSINLQKSGNLTSLTATNRATGTVQELVISFPTTVQYFAEISFWCNGKFSGNNIDYYVST